MILDIAIIAIHFLVAHLKIHLYLCLLSMQITAVRGFISIRVVAVRASHRLIDNIV